MDESTIIATRKNKTLQAREAQLKINLLGLNGGRPYIDDRLSRFAGESSIDWNGGVRKDGSAVTGRREQAHCIPYLSRIAEKINQYVFADPPKREGAKEQVIADITSDGENINAVMQEVNSYLTACRWCWIGIDAPEIEEGTQLSQAQKEALKIRPYWRVYSPLEVVDWYIDETGVVKWVITESAEVIANNFTIEPVNVIYRRVWTEGKVSVYLINEKDRKKTTLQKEIQTNSPGVPFVPCGKISPKPYEFDDLEGINRSIMDLESCNRQNFFNSVFPQLQIPESSLQYAIEAFQITAEEAVNRVIGYNYPILVGKDDKEASYIMPDASAIGTMRDELSKLKNELFEVVGLMLRKETKQVESAEAKNWDFLDINAVLKHRAETLEDIEKKAVKISSTWDASFGTWVPEYNKEFEIVDFKSDLEALVSVSNMSMPPELYRLALRQVYKKLEKISKSDLTEEGKKIITDSIENYSGLDFAPVETERVEV